MEERDKTIVDLYRIKGFSMVQISKKFGISSSGVGYILKKHGIERRTISDAVYQIYETQFGKKAFRLKNNLSAEEEKLRIAGIMLYWGEGAKRGNTVQFVNSDPEMIKLFLFFLREICGIIPDRLKALVHIYPDQNEQQLINFWIKTTGISKSNFYKSYVHKGRVGTYKNKALYGTIALNYADKRLLGTILRWIEEYKIK